MTYAHIMPVNRGVLRNSQVIHSDRTADSADGAAQHDEVGAGIAATKALRAIERTLSV